MTIPVTLHYSAAADQSHVSAVAQALGINACLVADTAQNNSASIALCYHESRWCLQMPRDSVLPNAALCIDFLNNAQRHRLMYGGGKSQLIAKAIGVHKASALRVLDATAGLGSDALVMAALGCEVGLCEKHPVLYFLLKHALDDARQQSELEQQWSDIFLRMHCVAGDAIDYLKHQHEANAPELAWDVIYLDPMFPVRKKTAKVKKPMQILHYLHASQAPNDSNKHKRDATQLEDNNLRLLETALNSNCRRVVVKRPVLAPCIGNREPSYQLASKTTRYDIYALRALSN